MSQEKITVSGANSQGADPNNKWCPKLVLKKGGCTKVQKMRTTSFLVWQSKRPRGLSVQQQQQPQESQSAQHLTHAYSTNRRLECADTYSSGVVHQHARYDLVCVFVCVCVYVCVCVCVATTVNQRVASSYIIGCASMRTLKPLQRHYT